MIQKLFIFILPTLILLSGCEGGVYLHPSPPEPQLNGFHVVDSDGISSESSPHHSANLDPYTNEGIFEVYWYADSYYDYRTYLSLNDRPGVRGAILLNQERCGEGLHCDYDGWLMCEYTADYYVGCGLDLTETHRNLTDVAELFQSVPEALYLNFEVCDTDNHYCEMDSRPVIMF